MDNLVPSTGVGGKLDVSACSGTDHTDSGSNNSMEKSDLNESSPNTESSDQQEATAGAITSEGESTKGKSSATSSSTAMTRAGTSESTSKSTGKKSTSNVLSAKSKVHSSSSGLPSVSSSFGPSSRLTNDFPLRIVVQSDMVGAIIGKSGGTIKDITKDSKARVDVLRKESNNSTDKVIAIYGTPENCSKAALKIMEVIIEEAKAIGKTGEDTPQLRILAHNSLIGRVIGKSGNTIKRVMESTDTKITVSTSIFDPNNAFNPERIITIKGNSVESVSKAESQITAKLRSSYESDFGFLASQPPAGLMAFPGIAPAMPMLPGGPLTTPAHPHQGHHPHPHARGSSGGGGSGGSGGTGGGSSGPSVPPYPATLYGPAAFLPSSAAAAAALLHHHHHPHAYPYPSGASPLSPGHGAAAGLAAASYLHTEQVKETAVVYIPHTAVGAVIGSGGTTIRDMINSSGANIKVAQSPSKENAAQGSSGDSTSKERRVTIVGTPEAQWKAQMLVFRKVLHESGLPGESTLKVEIMVPSSQVGRIIGKNGNTVRELQRLTRAQIKLPEPEERTNAANVDADAETPVSIIGDFLSSQSAQRQIRALVTRGQLSSQLASSSESYGSGSGNKGSKGKSNKSPSTTTTGGTSSAPSTTATEASNGSGEHKEESKSEAATGDSSTGQPRESNEPKAESSAQ